MQPPLRIAALAGLALVAALAAVTPGCGKRSAPSPAASASAPLAAPSSPAAVAVGCYQGCVDLNKGKPEQAEIKANCAAKCIRICSKSCASYRPSETREQALDDCKRQCAEQLGSPP